VVHLVIVDDPTNSIPPLGGGFVTSAFSKAAIDFSHLAELPNRLLKNS